MRRVSTCSLLAVAAACWLAAGPGGVAVQAALACRHHAAHHHHGGHGGHGAPADAPCFCDEMTGGADQAVSVAMPARAALAPVIAVSVVVRSDAAPFALPPSPDLAPESPPPIGVA